MKNVTKVTSEDIRNFIAEAREGLEALRRAYDRAADESRDLSADDYREGSIGAAHVAEALDGIERCLMTGASLAALPGGVS